MVRGKKIIILVIGLCLVLPCLANAHHVSDKTPDAIAEMEYRIKLDLEPGDVETRYKLGSILYRKGLMNEALEQFKTVLKTSPQHFHAHEGIGLVIMKEGRYKEAAGWFEKAKQIDENDVDIYYHLGSAYTQSGETVKAVKAYKTLLSLKEDAAISKELKRLEQSLEKGH